MINLGVVRFAKRNTFSSIRKGSLEGYRVSKQGGNAQQGAADRRQSHRVTTMDLQLKASGIITRDSARRVLGVAEGA